MDKELSWKNSVIPDIYLPLIVTHTPALPMAAWPIIATSPQWN
jgi:hypothetical protein